MLPAHDESQLLEVVERSRSMAARGFGNAEVYLERLLERPRHVEFQVLGDQHGNAVHLYRARLLRAAPQPESDRGSAGAPRIPRERSRRRPPTASRRIMREMGYDNIGTVEMLMGADGSFNFLEMNTRLQVEHGVTEEVTGVDLVQAQIRSRGGRAPSGSPSACDRDAAVMRSRRACMRKTRKISFPSPGKLNVFRPPADRRARRHGLCRRPRCHAALRSDDRESDRSCRDARGGDRQADRGARSVRDPRRQEQHSGGARDPAVGTVPRGPGAHGPDSRKCWGRKSRWIARSTIAEARAQRAARSLDEAAGKALLAHYGIAVPQTAVVIRHAEDAEASLQDFRLPVVVKVVSRDILHKSDAGGVRVDSENRGASAERHSRHGRIAGDRPRPRRRLADRGNGAGRPGDRRRRLARSAVRAARHGGPRRHLRRSARRRGFSHLPDHAARCRRDARRAERRGRAERRARPQNPLREKPSSTCC